MSNSPASNSVKSAHALPSYLNAEHLGPWGIYLQQVDRVTPYLGSLSRWVETLKRPKRALIVDVPIELDNGNVAHFEGYRVHHNTVLGPTKGGIRYHPEVSLGEVSADIKAILDKTPWPANYHYRFGGSTKDMKESFGFAVIAMVLAIIFILLYFTYGSAVEAAHVLLAVPFAPFSSLSV